MDIGDKPMGFGRSKPVDMDDYVEANRPDPVKLKVLLDRARGADTMEVFAGKCDSNAPKFSRMTNEKIRLTRPIDKALLEKIRMKSAEELQLNELMEAAGWALKWNPNKLAEEQKKQDNLIENVIKEALWSRGYSLRVIRRSAGITIRREFPAEKDYNGFPDVPSLFTLNAQKGETDFIWRFFLDDSRWRDDEDPESREGQNRKRYRLTALLRDWAPLFLKDLWEEEKGSGRNRITFIFIDKKEFRIFSNALKESNARVNGDISLLLFDLEKKEIIGTEEFIPRRDRVISKSFFEEQVVPF